MIKSYRRDKGGRIKVPREIIEKAADLWVKTHNINELGPNFTYLSLHNFSWR